MQPLSKGGSHRYLLYGDARAIAPIGVIANGGEAGADLLMDAVDRINAREGRVTVRLGRIPARADWSMTREMLSQRYTARWVS